MKVRVISFACLVAAGLFQPVFAQTATSQVGTIVPVNTGWNSDTFTLSTTAPVINPASCASADFYESTSTDPVYKTHLAAVLTAFSAKA